MEAIEVFEKAMESSQNMGLTDSRYALRSANDGALQDALDIGSKRTYYYRWVQGFVKEFKPKQVIELGGAMGVWCLMVLQKLPKDSHLYSITLPEDGLEFSYVVDDYPNFHPVLGTSLDLSLWPEDFNLKKTDLWFFDSLHTEEHLRKELDLYSRYFKKGAVILIDDIHSFGLEPVWKEIKKWGIASTYDATNPLHYSGYGIGVV